MFYTIILTKRTCTKKSNRYRAIIQKIYFLFNIVPVREYFAITTVITKLLKKSVSLISR